MRALATGTGVGATGRTRRGTLPEGARSVSVVVSIAASRAAATPYLIAHQHYDHPSDDRLNAGEVATAQGLRRGEAAP